MTTYTNASAIRNAIALLVDNGVIAENDELVDKLQKVAISFEHKHSSAKHSVSKTTIINNGIRAEILAVLSSDAGMTIADICNAVPSCAEKTTHQMAGLLSALVKSGAVTRTKQGKETFFSLPDAEVAETVEADEGDAE